VNRNLILGVVAVLLLGALGYWLASISHWEEVEIPGTPKGEALTNPFYSLQHLSESLGAHTRVRHEIVSMPPPGSIIVLDFWNWDMIPERRQRLEQWVSDGGRLVVNFAQLNEGGFQEWSGIKPLADSSYPRQTHRPLQSDGNTCGRRETLLTASSEPHEQFDTYGFTPSGITTTRKNTWRLRDEDGITQALRIPIGRGSVTLLNALLVSNRGVLCGDYGLLFAAATQLHHGDTITFLTEGKGGSLLGLIWQYGAPVVALAGVWITLWLWRSAVRFGPLAAPTESARRSLAEQIRGTGQFTLRFGGGAALYAATVRALNEVASRHILHYERLSASERVRALEKVTRLNAADLTRALEDRDARSRKEIRNTLALLEAARRRLIAAMQ
jgi:hypothetical protein